MTPDQLREARALLGWSTERLSAYCNVGGHVIARYEKTGHLIPAGTKLKNPVDRLSAIRTALEAAGVIFTNGDEPGVKLRNAP